MKKQITILFLACALHVSAFAVISSTSVENIFATIPDGDLNGVSSQLVTGLSGNIGDVNVTLTISGGFNGDYYAYLLHNGTSAILLNRAGVSASNGVGYSDAGFGVDGSAVRLTFDDQAAHDVHLYRTFPYALNGNGQLTGAWQPDGRATDPLSNGSFFDSAARSKTLSGFNGTDPNGTWTLFVSDVSSGSEGVLVNWGLNITLVPEPTATTLLIFGFLGFLALRSLVTRAGVAQTKGLQAVISVSDGNVVGRVPSRGVVCVFQQPA